MPRESRLPRAQYEDGKRKQTRGPSWRRQIQHNWQGTRRDRKILDQIYRAQRVSYYLISKDPFFNSQGRVIYLSLKTPRNASPRPNLSDGKSPGFIQTAFAEPPVCVSVSVCVCKAPIWRDASVVVAERLPPPSRVYGIYGYKFNFGSYCTHHPQRS